MRGVQEVFWTEERIARVRALRDAGKLNREIAEALGCELSRLSRLITRLNLERRPKFGAAKVAAAPQPLRPGTSTLPPLPSEGEGRADD